VKLFGWAARPICRSESGGLGAARVEWEPGTLGVTLFDGLVVRGTDLATGAELGNPLGNQLNRFGLDGSGVWVLAKR
jgi:hypothetical protein